MWICVLSEKNAGQNRLYGGDFEIQKGRRYIEG